MGTKNNPGRFDCYASAAPDEPLFTLRAKDPLAPALVDMWAAIRLGDHAAARRAWDELMGHCRPSSLDDVDAHVAGVDKVTEARVCAAQMRGWKEIQVAEIARSSARPTLVDGCANMATSSRHRPRNTLGDC